MGVSYAPESKFAQEMAKWESGYSQYGPPGRPYVFAEFPKRLSKASRPYGGGPVSFDAVDANDEHEERNLLSRGFCCGRDKALAALEQEEFVRADGAARRAFGDRQMSAGAQREAQIADDQTMEHLPSIPEQPRRGRKPRAKAEVSNG